MIIERVSPLTGTKTIMDIPVTEEQITAWKNGTLIQEAMPNISADEREFIKTGLTSDDWEVLFGKDK